MLLTIRAFVDIRSCRLWKYLVTLQDRSAFIVEDFCLPLLVLCSWGVETTARGHNIQWHTLHKTTQYFRRYGVLLIVIFAGGPANESRISLLSLYHKSLDIPDIIFFVVLWKCTERWRRHPFNFSILYQKCRHSYLRCSFKMLRSSHIMPIGRSKRVCSCRGARSGCVSTHVPSVYRWFFLWK